MSRLDELPADQKATLQLLLKQGKSYQELAALLRLEPGAVRERALNALDALGPETTDGLTPQRQDEVSDYLLGQQAASARAGTRSFLEGSAAGRSWARAVASELRPVAGDALPDVPAEAAEVEEAFGALSARHEARERQEHSSQIGGVLLLLGAAAIVAVLVVLIVSRLGGSDSSSNSGSSGSASTTALAGDTTATSGSTAAAPGTTATTGTGAGGATTPAAAAAAIKGLETEITMNATSGNALAAGLVIKRGATRVLEIQGQNFPPTDKSFNYAVWLYNSPTSAKLLGFVGSGVSAGGATKGRLITGADPDQIQKDAAKLTDAKQKAAAQATATQIRALLGQFYTYKELVITKETGGQTPTTPGTIVVSGAITQPKAH